MITVCIHQVTISQRDLGWLIAAFGVFDIKYIHQS